MTFCDVVIKQKQHHLDDKDNIKCYQWPGERWFLRVHILQRKQSVGKQADICLKETVKHLIYRKNKKIGRLSMKS